MCELNIEQFKQSMINSTIPTVIADTGASAICIQIAAEQM